jgi:hypothetical protein
MIFTLRRSRFYLPAQNSSSKDPNGLTQRQFQRRQIIPEEFMPGIIDDL